MRRHGGVLRRATPSGAGAVNRRRGYRRIHLFNVISRRSSSVAIDVVFIIYSIQSYLFDLILFIRSSLIRVDENRVVRRFGAAGRRWADGRNAMFSHFVAVDNNSERSSSKLFNLRIRT